MSRKKNKKFQIVSSDEKREINLKVSRSAHHQMMMDSSVRGEAQGKRKYSRKEKYKPIYR